MIRRILTYYAASLDEYLHHKFPQPEGIAEVGFIGSGAGEKRGSRNLVGISIYLCQPKKKKLSVCHSM